jgi:ketosteroid isomerase-like protein
MKLVMVFVSAVLAMTVSGSARADVTRDVPEAVVPVEAVIAAIKSDNVAAISTLYSSNAVVVDDQAPFEWTGPDAGARWLLASSDSSKWSRRIAHFRAALADIRVDSSTGGAYVIVAGAFSSANPKEPWQQHGTLTFTLKELNNHWKVISQVWAQTPCSLAPAGCLPSHSLFAH